MSEIANIDFVNINTNGNTITLAEWVKMFDNNRINYLQLFDDMAKTEIVKAEKDLVLNENVLGISQEEWDTLKAELTDNKIINGNGEIDTDNLSNLSNLLALFYNNRLAKRNNLDKKLTKSKRRNARLIEQPAP